MDEAKEYFVVDRIESGRIIIQSLESAEIFNVESDIFTDEPIEGNAIFLEEGRFKTDYEYSAQRKKSLALSLSKLLSRKGKKKPDEEME